MVINSASIDSLTDYSPSCYFYTIQVHVCEAEHAAEFLSCDFLHFEPGSGSLLVAVKMLRPDASNEAR